MSGHRNYLYKYLLHELQNALDEEILCIEHCYMESKVSVHLQRKGKTKCIQCTKRLIKDNKTLCITMLKLYKCGKT